MKSVVVTHLQNFVAHRTVEVPRNETGTNAFDFMLARRSPTQHRAFGLNRHSQNTRELLLHVARNSGESACRSRPKNDSIESAFHLLENFFGCSFVMIIGVRRVLELACHERSRSVRRILLRLLDSAQHTFVVRRTGHFCAQGTHDFDFFLRETLRNEQDNFVSAIDADQGQADSGVPGGGLNNDASTLEQAIFFRTLDNPDCCAVFHASAGVQIFEFGKNVGTICGHDPAEVQHRRLPNKFGNVFGYPQRGLGQSWHTTGYNSIGRSGHRSWGHRVK